MNSPAATRTTSAPAWLNAGALFGSSNGEKPLNISVPWQSFERQPSGIGCSNGDILLTWYRSQKHRSNIWKRAASHECKERPHLCRWMNRWFGLPGCLSSLPSRAAPSAVIMQVGRRRTSSSDDGAYEPVLLFRKEIAKAFART